MAVQKYLSTQYASHPKYPNLNPAEPPIVDFQSRNQSLKPDLPSFHKLNPKKSMLALKITVPQRGPSSSEEVCLVGTAVLLSSMLSTPSGCIS